MIGMARRTPIWIALMVALVTAACTYAPARRGPPYPDYYYDYYYYPHTDVYFQLYTGEYYYRTGRDWHRARILPRVIYLDPRERVTIRIRDPKPYLHAPAHRKAYPPPPNYRYVPNRERDRAEREHNLRQHEQFRDRYRR